MTAVTDDVIAGVRAYTLPQTEEKGARTTARPRPAPEGFPTLVLLLDTETTTDPTQRLRFGSYRLCEWRRDADGRWILHCLEEGLFYGDDLPTRAPKDFRALQDYVRRAFADTPDTAGAILPLYSRTEFVDRVLWKAGMVGRALIVGFNLPFDLSRLAVEWAEARGRRHHNRFVKGFSFVIWGTFDAATKTWTPNTVRPRLRIKHHDSKSADMQCTSSNAPELLTGHGRTRRSYAGRFLDLKTFAFALLDKAHTLQSLADALGTSQPKGHADYAGPITPEYIAYNRQDVRLCQQVLAKLREEFDRHPIAVDPWQLRSPASLAKAYLRAAGITPLARRLSNSLPELFGPATAAYYGGRTEYHVPRVVVPVVYTDFLSMYPTVQSLAKLREWLTAAHFTVTEYAATARMILDKVTVDTALQPELWPTLRFFALVAPDDDVLPVRARFSPHSVSFSIAVTRLTAPEMPMWYTGFDLAASVLLTGRVPRIVKAFLLTPVGTLSDLRSIRLRNQVDLNARGGDIFQQMVELRHRTKNDSSIPPEQRKQLESVLKSVANSGSYGIFAEMNPQDLPDGKTRPVDVIGNGDSFRVDSTKPEEPGEYCFPPMAAAITGAARLLLAIVEKLVADRGGSYAFCDTDSMAIIATETGGFLPCPGGTIAGPDGIAGVRILSWADVDQIIAQLEALKPYGPSVQSTLLKIEDENYVDGQRTPLFAYGLSAKRYCLFRRSTDGDVIIAKASEHGLGQLLDPTDPEGQRKGATGAAAWIEEVWRRFVEEVLGRAPNNPPDWFAFPAVARHGYSSPQLLGPHQRQQLGMPYSDQVKPFNFGATCYLTADGAPAGTDIATCHLMGPYERDPKKWLTQEWVDTASGTVCGISTRPATSARIAQVKSVADVVAQYAAHAEVKSAAPDGRPATAHTRGLLARRHVTPIHLFHLGKETNRLEEVERGEIRQLSQVQEIFDDSQGSAWERVYRPRLRAANIRELAEESGISESLLRKYRQGSTLPTPRQMRLLVACLNVAA